MQKMQKNIHGHFEGGTRARCRYTYRSPVVREIDGRDVQKEEKDRRGKSLMGGR